MGSATGIVQEILLALLLVPELERKQAEMRGEQVEEQLEEEPPVEELPGEELLEEEQPEEERQGEERPGVAQSQQVEEMWGRGEWESAAVRRSE